MLTMFKEPKQRKGQRNAKNVQASKVAKAVPIKVYAQTSQEKISQLQNSMDSIGDRQDPNWNKLRKQQIAQEARLRNRTRQEEVR